jgi:large subunit ribosomal protein L10
LATESKKESIDSLNEKFSKATSAVLARYQGITANEMNSLRSHLRERSLEILVVKNTLAKIAAKDTSFEALDSDFKGPVSVVVGYGEVVGPAKALADYSKTGPAKEPEVICGLVEGKKIAPEGVKALADLPPKEVLVAQLLSTMQAPTTNFVGVFSGILRQFVGVLDAIKEKKSNE